MNLREYCTGIADAIREQEGSTELIPASEHASRIKSIQTGVDISNDTVIAEALVEGYTAHDASGVPITGTNPYAKEATNTTVNTQADLIAQIQTALEEKSGASDKPDVGVITINIEQWGTQPLGVYYRYFNENNELQIQGDSDAVIHALGGAIMVSTSNDDSVGGQLGYCPGSDSIICTGDYVKSGSLVIFKSNGGTITVELFPH